MGTEWDGWMDGWEPLDTYIALGIHMLNRHVCENKELRRFI